jgi:hypothetical protein
MKFILCCLFVCIYCVGFSQYIGVKARYTETRLVDDSPNPPKRENRLILSFFEVTFNGTENVWTPTVLTNYDLWIYQVGLQYGSLMGGVLDSTGNNYPSYAYTAPKVVSYYNSLGIPYIDCNPNIATHYVVNGSQLDCGFITVSYWDVDWGTMQPFEAFPAPNICLPYYSFGDPYYFNPGNVNFDWSVLFPGPPYNLYNFSCGGSLQLVMRGLLVADTGSTVVVLPVRFANVRADIDAADRVTISWSNMTESDILNYTIESSADGIAFQSTGTVWPTQNNGGRADYNYYTNQTAERVYYRIKAIESTGTVLYSNVLVVRRNIPTAVNGEESFSVYPNPVIGNEFNFRLSNAPAGRYISSIVTPSGQQVKQKMIEHNGGDLTRQVDMSGLQPGLYQLVLRSSTKKFTQKIIYIY